MGFLDALKTNFATRFYDFRIPTEVMRFCEGPFLCECWGRVCIESKGAGNGTAWGVYTTQTHWHSVIRWPATVIPAGRLWKSSGLMKSATRNFIVQRVLCFLSSQSLAQLTRAKCHSHTWMPLKLFSICTTLCVLPWQDLHLTSLVLLNWKNVISLIRWQMLAKYIF